MGANGRPDWSPDGKGIAYGSVLGSRLFFAVMDADGSYMLADGEGPDWSPDGSWIAFSRGGQIWAMPDGPAQAR